MEAWQKLFRQMLIICNTQKAFRERILFQEGKALTKLLPPTLRKDPRMLGYELGFESLNSSVLAVLGNLYRNQKERYWLPSGSSL